MKYVTIHDIRNLEHQLCTASCALIARTMEDNNLGIKEAYDKCKKEYKNKYRRLMPTPY
jgi:hypothetical protein